MTSFPALIEGREKQLKGLGRRFAAVGFIKLFLILAFAGCAYAAVSMGFPPAAVVIGAVSGLFFAFFAAYHAKLQKKMDHIRRLIELHRRQLDRQSGKWAEFADTGEELADPEHDYAGDLDIVGKKSLFQFLNVTNTWFGRRAFADDLLRPSYSGEQIRRRQQAIAELADDPDGGGQLACLLADIGPHPAQQELPVLLQDARPFARRRGIRWILRGLPLITLPAAVISLAPPLRFLAPLGAVLLLTQAVLWVVGIAKTQKYLSAVKNLPYRLSAFAPVFELVGRRRFASEELCALQKRLGGSGSSAIRGIRELGRIADRMNARRDPIFCFVLNVLFLWDYESAFRLERWRAVYAGCAQAWFSDLGELESLLSFANLPLACSRVCLPAPDGSGPLPDARELGHPLLNNRSRIGNDVRLDRGILILSGSNMSGKTTFLRTVGINLVLAQAGSFVCAASMRFSPCRIITSMRIADNLNEGISTFYAELKRVKRIVEAAKTERRLLFLIDEIFRGTNSGDRLSGARTVLSRLNALGASGMITTHDLELCTLEQSARHIRNAHFSEQYRDRRLFFDYTLRPGVAVSTNARYLMEMVGIL